MSTDDVQEQIRQILASADQDFTDVEVGKTMVLYRAKEDGAVMLVSATCERFVVARSIAVLTRHRARSQGDGQLLAVGPEWPGGHSRSPRPT